MNYFDTSALIKQFVEEAGSHRVERLIAAEPELATCRVAYAEVHASLARGLRDGSLAQAAYERASRSFDSEWTLIFV
jgi:predicted nucleic acid-binding protein